jgi:glucan 1,3-beta-glucosidase
MTKEEKTKEKKKASEAVGSTSSAAAAAAAAAEETAATAAAAAATAEPAAAAKRWIRGVNLGGWLLLERYITPYQFAVTDCHLRGEPCWYPGQVSAPPDHEAAPLCDPSRCAPHRTVQDSSSAPDYPVDEYALGRAFLTAPTVQDGTPRPGRGVANAESWLNVHFDNFLRREDLVRAREAGVTHVRVPLPHWILGDVRLDEPWIVADRWTYFARMCSWARALDLQVWPDVHTAPGSQNGFDNSGQALPYSSCRGWSGSEEHVMRSLRVIGDVTARIREEGLNDVVTGFGLLNEPFKDCDRDVYLDFIDRGRDVVRANLGEGTAVYVSDMFQADAFNDGRWWLDGDRYGNTYLDSHYYHVFASRPRELSPRQHVAFTCQRQYRDAVSCCYRDPALAGRPWQHATGGGNRRPSAGVRRLFGEWSAAYDALPVAVLSDVMTGIRETGRAPHLDRRLTPAEVDFLGHFAQAQQVAYEAAERDTSAGWFYWTLKVEGGAFAEWDFLRGLREGWLRLVSDPTVSSQAVFGSCYDILFRTNDTDEVIRPYPAPEDLTSSDWAGPPIDDDVVVSHGQSLLDRNGNIVIELDRHPNHTWLYLLIVAVAAVALRFARPCCCRGRNKKSEYEPIQELVV